MNRFPGAALIAAIAVGGISTAAAAKPQEKAGNKDPMICRYYAKTTSRIGSDRVCMRKSEWDDAILQGAIDMEKFKIENTGRPLVTGPGTMPTRRN
jgi:hypothetical protein